MNYADKYACDILFNCKSEKFSEKIRMFQGCPTIAVTKGGRIYLGWYAGGIKEPHMNNYNLLVYSDDEGKTWSKPLFVIPSSYELNIHALDIQIFIAPSGELHVVWVQNNTVVQTEENKYDENGNIRWNVDGYIFEDARHSSWEMICYDPDAEKPVFTEPKFVYPGFLRCKPTFLKNGDWLCFAYDQLTNCYGYNITTDSGKTYIRCYGGEKIDTPFDETMAYQKNDGSVRMFARSSIGELAETTSYDNGRTWEKAKPSGITAANTRFYVEKLPSGNVLLVHNDHPTERTRMTIKLSEDDGKSWKYSKCIDIRQDISYPDAAYKDGKIYLTYDCGRTSDKEILFASFTEEDIIYDREIKVSVISKPPCTPDKSSVISAISENKIIAILRDIPTEKLIPVAQALYDGGIKLLEITFGSGIDDEQTSENIKLLADSFKDRMYIGAGTVLTEKQVRLTKAAGGCFVISPNTDAKVIRESFLCGMVSIPGALTPSEICEAQRFGADFIKLFPAVNADIKYVKALKAPLSEVRFLMVGGIDTENMKELMKAGVSGFGVGSSLVKSDLVESENYSQITAIAKQYTEMISCG